MVRTSLLAGTTIALLGAFLGLYYLPRRAQTPVQPISFSHKIHVSRGIPCAFCHQDAGRSTFAGLPPVMTCMGCHRIIIPQYPEVQKLHAYWQQQIPIPWKRVNFVPDYVRFTHQPHIAAGVACSACHGDIAHEDRVTTAVDFKMATCITCHRSMNARTDCFEACHH